MLCVVGFIKKNKYVYIFTKASSRAFGPVWSKDPYIKCTYWWKKNHPRTSERERAESLPQPKKNTHKQDGEWTH